MDKLLPPTLEEVEKFLHDIGEDYKPAELEGVESWQRHAMRHISEHSHAILQGPRQWFGKSWLVSRYAACCLCRGLSVMVSYPTQGQGEQIMIDRIDFVMRVVESKYAMKRQKPDNVRLKRWDSPYGPVVLKVLSLSEGAKAGTQGFTGDVWVCDEAQECTVIAYEAVEPAMDIAIAEGRGKIILLGIGGNSTEHLIEAKKPVEDKHWREEGDWVDAEEMDTPFVARRFTTTDITDAAPSLIPFYEKKKRTTSAPSWRQNYECLPNEEGVGRVFPRIVPHAESNHKMQPWMEFGIDVGRKKDATVVVAMSCEGDAANYVDGLIMTGRDFYTQAKKIAEWIGKFTYLPRNVRVEANSLGFGLIDALALHSPFHAVTPVWTTDSPPDFDKTTWILRLQHMALTGKLGIPDPALRSRLLRLTYEQKENGQYNWDLAHDDVLSALWVWISTRGGSFAI
jgi:hypothetical protein